MNDQPTVRCIPITDAESERLFYDEVSRIIRGAREAIYRSGTGYQHEDRAQLYRQLRLAEEDALSRGVQVTRIHTGTTVSLSWAAAYSDLLDRFPQRLRFFVDLDSTYFSDIGIIDPFSYDPVIYLLFETPEPVTFGTGRRPSIFLVIDGAHSFARALCQQFVTRAHALMPLTSNEVRDLGSTYVYFGWGIHMASRTVRRDIPDARRLGVAVLRGWRRDVSTLLGPDRVMSVYHTGDPSDSFDGVAYEISWWAKTRLDRLEGRTYQSVPIVIDLDAKQVKAFTYLALPSQRPGQLMPMDSWIRTVVDGAEENNLAGLLAELRELGVPQ